MKKIFFLSIFILLLYSCSSKDDSFKEWITERGGTKFETSDMDFLINEFGNPIDTINLSDTKKLKFQNEKFFWGPSFNKNESIENIGKYREKINQLKEWMTVSGRKHGDSPENYLSSYNPNWERYKDKLNELYDEYKIIYNKKTGGRDITFTEFVNSFKNKFPKYSLTQCKDSVSNFLNLNDFRKKEFTSITYRFVTDDNESYHKRYGNKNLRNFQVLIYRDLTINNDGTIDENTYNDSFCINESSKEDLMEYVIGDWVYGDLMSTFKFMKDGTYSYNSKLFKISLSGRWWIDCSGEIVRNDQNSTLKVTNEGIMSGTTLYKKQ
jgi:hypothetical protein